MGSHILNIKGTLSKTSLSKHGSPLSTTLSHDTSSLPITADVIKASLNNGEGCRLRGSFEVMRVPGNFHISSHAYGDVIKEMLMTYNDLEFDMSHTVNHISFGNENELTNVENEFKGVGNLSPLDMVYTKDNKDNMLFEYYLNIVPTIYGDVNGKEIKVHQYTYNKSKSQSGLLIPTIYFRYDISPILVKYTQDKPKAFNVVVNVCAVLGGLITISGMLHSLILKLIKKHNKDI
jgi:hypothetical protein